MPQPASRSLRFSVDVGWNLFGQAGLLALGFLLVPLLVSGLGTEGYALYGLLGIIAGYLSLLNLGAPSGTQRAVAELSARGETGQLWPLLAFSALLHTAGVLVGAVAVFLFRGPMSHHLLDISPGMTSVGTWVIACAALGAVFYSWAQFSAALLQGLQDFASSPSSSSSSSSPSRCWVWPRPCAACRGPGSRGLTRRARGISSATV